MSMPADTPGGGDDVVVLTQRLSTRVALNLASSSVIVGGVCLDTCVSWTSARRAAISPCVNPLADNDSTIPSILSSRRCRLRTMAGSELPSRFTVSVDPWASR
jgi:hypothetical protein